MFTAIAIRIEGAARRPSGWAVAGMLSLVLHASLPMLGHGRTVVADERITMSIVEFTAPIAEEPTPVVDEVPVVPDAVAGPEGPSDAPEGAPLVPDATDETPRAVVEEAAPVVEEAPVEVAPAEEVVEEIVEDGIEETAPVEEAVPAPVEPVVEEAAPVEEAPPPPVARLPRLDRERGVPARTFDPRIRRRPPNKTRVAVSSNVSSNVSSKVGARGGKASAPPAALKEGEPDDIWACEATDRGYRAQVKKERPITEWVTLLPTALFAYPTEPALTDYLGGVAQVTARQRRHIKRVGKWEFAMPRGEIEVELASPLGVRAYLGRDDARCLVGFESTKGEFFPMTLKRVPVRIVDEEGHEDRVLADVRFHKDARFELLARSDEGSVDEDLPFDEGTLENAALIERTVDAHMGTARTFASVASFFGFDIEKLMVDEQKRRMKKLREREARAQAATTSPSVKTRP